MNIFLSYSSHQLKQAEEIAVGLRSEGHDVFFDQASLKPGKVYNKHIRQAINRADCFVALLSPSFVSGGRYTLTELELIQDRWPNPDERVLPVMIEQTPIDKIPSYLRAVTILEPKGNVTAEILDALADIQPLSSHRTFLWRASAIAVGVAAVTVLAYVAGVMAWQWKTAQPMKPGFDFLERTEIEKARWSNGTDQRRLLIDHTPRDDPKLGDVRLHIKPVKLENGELVSGILQTHPRWTSNGLVLGSYGPFKIRDGLIIEGVVGFLFRQGGGGNGVRYRILFHPLLFGEQIEIWSNIKTNDGHLRAFQKDLQAISGRVGKIVLEVSANGDSGADWASWVNLKVR